MLTGLIIPKILLIAFRRNLFDTVDERKIHRGVVPRLGGMAFLPAMVFTWCMVVGYNLRFVSSNMNLVVGSGIVPILFLVCSLMLIYLVGLADDLIGVRYRAKFIFQIIAGILIVASGMYLSDLQGFLWIHDWPKVLGWIMTVVVVIFVVNAVNLIDGIDGLASGLSAVALLWYSYMFYMSGEYLYMLVAGASLGTLIPFFYFNVFGNAEHHTKIFMGDTGSLTIGLILVFLSLAVANMDLPTGSHSLNTFILAVAPLLLPCLDVVRVFLHRIRKGNNPFLPDKCHIHHKLLAIGFRQRKALVLIVLSDMVFVLINLLLSPVVQPTFIVIGDILLWTVANIILTKVIRKKEKKLCTKLYD